MHDKSQRGSGYGYRRTRRGAYGAAFVAAAAALPLVLSQPVAAAQTGEILSAGGATAVADSYIVVFKNSAVSVAAVDTRAATLAEAHGGAVTHTYRDALRGFAVSLPESAARRLAANPSVAYVEQDHTVRLAGTQAPTSSWGLDRVDQRALPLDNSYTYPNGGEGVRAYILDTGVRATHRDFGGRAVHGRDTVDNDNDSSDCNGHGTHVAGTVGGTSYGIAKGVTIVGVRIMDCAGTGQWSDVIAGVDWVTADHDPGERAVANMSIGGGKYQALNDAVAASIRDGVSYAVAAGNETTDACTRSPASTPEAITAGATDKNDKRASFSNFGSCLDLFAPGVSIVSAWWTGDDATYTASGTSMASPHVAGVAALITAANPSFTPKQVHDKMVADATPGVVTDPRTGSPNKLLYVDNGTPVEDDFTVAVAPSSGATDPGGSVAATVSTDTVTGDPQTVTFSAKGLPEGATAAFAPESVTTDESSALTISTTAATPAGTYPITINAAGDVTRQATFTMTVNGQPGEDDFAVSVSPASGSTDAGGSVSATVSTRTVSGNAQSVTLAAKGLPEGATAAFTPESVTTGGTSTLKISTTAATAAGTYEVSINAFGADVTRWTTYTLTVNAVTPPAGCDDHEVVKTGRAIHGGSSYQPEAGYFYSAAAGTHKACLEGPDGSDFDLFLEKWGRTGWVTVASSTENASDEHLTYTGESGYYRYHVRANNGGGNYKIGYDVP